MASQLLPLELIDRCVGSPIWVIMKGDKGLRKLSIKQEEAMLTMAQSLAALYSDLTTSSVCLTCTKLMPCYLQLIQNADMVLEDVTEL